MTRSPSNVVAGLTRERCARLVQRRSDQEVALGESRDVGLAQLLGTVRGDGQQPTDQGLPERQVASAAGRLADHHAQLDEAEVLPAEVGGRGQAQEAGLGARLPAGLGLLGALLEDVGEDGADLVLQL